MAAVHASAETSSGLGVAPSNDNYAFLTENERASLFQLIINHLSLGQFEIARAHMHQLKELDAELLKNGLREVMLRGPPAGWVSTASVPSFAHLCWLCYVEYCGLFPEASRDLALGPVYQHYIDFEMLLRSICAPRSPAQDQSGACDLTLEAEAYTSLLWQTGTIRHVEQVRERRVGVAEELRQFWHVIYDSPAPTLPWPMISEEDGDDLDAFISECSTTGEQLLFEEANRRTLKKVLRARPILGRALWRHMSGILPGNAQPKRAAWRQQVCRPLLTQLQHAYLEIIAELIKTDPLRAVYYLPFLDVHVLCPGGLSSESEGLEGIFNALLALCLGNAEEETPSTLSYGTVYESLLRSEDPRLFQLFCKFEDSYVRRKKLSRSSWRGIPLRHVMIPQFSAIHLARDPQEWTFQCSQPTIQTSEREWADLFTFVRLGESTGDRPHFLELLLAEALSLVADAKLESGGCDSDLMTKAAAITGGDFVRLRPLVVLLSCAKYSDDIVAMDALLVAFWQRAGRLCVEPAVVDACNAIEYAISMSWWVARRSLDDGDEAKVQETANNLLGRLMEARVVGFMDAVRGIVVDTPPKDLLCAVSALPAGEDGASMRSGRLVILRAHYALRCVTRVLGIEETDDDTERVDEALTSLEEHCASIEHYHDRVAVMGRAYMLLHTAVFSETRPPLPLSSSAVVRLLDVVRGTLLDTTSAEGSEPFLCHHVFAESTEEAASVLQNRVEEALFRFEVARACSEHMARQESLDGAPASPEKHNTRILDWASWTSPLDLLALCQRYDDYDRVRAIVDFFDVDAASAGVLKRGEEAELLRGALLASETKEPIEVGLEKALYCAPANEALSTILDLVMSSPSTECTAQLVGRANTTTRPSEDASFVRRKVHELHTRMSVFVDEESSVREALMSPDALPQDPATLQEFLKHEKQRHLIVKALRGTVHRWETETYNSARAAKVRAPDQRADVVYGRVKYYARLVSTQQGQASAHLTDLSATVDSMLFDLLEDLPTVDPKGDFLPHVLRYVVELGQILRNCDSSVQEGEAEEGKKRGALSYLSESPHELLGRLVVEHRAYDAAATAAEHMGVDLVHALLQCCDASISPQTETKALRTPTSPGHSPRAAKDDAFASAAGNYISSADFPLSMDVVRYLDQENPVLGFLVALIKSPSAMAGGDVSYADFAVAKAESFPVLARFATLRCQLYAVFSSLFIANAPPEELGGKLGDVALPLEEMRETFLSPLSAAFRRRRDPEGSGTTETTSPRKKEVTYTRVDDEGRPVASSPLRSPRGRVASGEHQAPTSPGGVAKSSKFAIPTRFSSREFTRSLSGSFEEVARFGSLDKSTGDLPPEQTGVEWKANADELARLDVSGYDAVWRSIVDRLVVSDRYEDALFVANEFLADGAPDFLLKVIVESSVEKRRVTSLIAQMSDKNSSASLILKHHHFFDLDTNIDLMRGCKEGIPDGNEMHGKIGSLLAKMEAYDEVLQLEESEWSEWRQLDAACDTDPEGVVHLLIGWQQYDLARRIAAQSGEGMQRVMQNIDQSYILHLFQKGNTHKAIKVLSSINQVSDGEAVAVCTGLMEKVDSHETRLLLIDFLIHNEGKFMEPQMLSGLHAQRRAAHFLLKLPPHLQEEFEALPTDPIKFPDVIIETLLMRQETAVLGVLFADVTHTEYDKLILAYVRMALKFKPIQEEPTVEEMTSWVLTGDVDHDAAMRSAHSYPNTPSLNLAKSLLSLVATSTAAQACLELCDELSKKLSGKRVDLFSMDRTIDVIQRLLVHAKHLFVQDGTGIAVCDTFLSHIDLLQTMAAQRTTCTASLADFSDPSKARMLRDNLVAEDRMEVAIEVATKCHVDTEPVWFAWGVDLLKLGKYKDARSKLKYCLSSKDAAVNSKAARGGQDNSRLLSRIIEVLESRAVVTLASLRDLGEQMAKVQEAPAASRSDFSFGDGFSVETFMHALQLSGDSSSTARMLVAAEQRVSSRSNLTRVRCDEAVYYLSTYGTPRAVSAFYTRHGLLHEAVEFALECELPANTFVADIIQPLLQQGRLQDLQEAFLEADPELKRVSLYLVATCSFLHKHKHAALLYSFQVFMKDEVRAGLTCVNVFLQSRDPDVRLLQLDRASDHFTKGLANLQHAGRQARQQEKGSNSGLMAESTVSEYLQRVSTQMETTRFLGGELMELSLFSTTQEKCVLAEEILLRDKFDLAFKIIMSFRLPARKIYVNAVKRLAGEHQTQAIEGLLRNVKAIMHDNDVDEIVMEVINTFANSMEGEVKTAEKFISKLSADTSANNKITALIWCQKLKTAYLCAVKINATDEIKRIKEAAETMNDRGIASLCQKFLAQSGA